MSTPGGRKGGGASLYDFRDLDILQKIAAEEDAEGWVELEPLARSLGLGDDHNRNVAVRLAWMRRYGMLARDDEKGLWRLSPGGLRVVQAKVKAAAQHDLEELPDEAMVEVMANVAARYRFADATTAHLLRREFLFGTQRR
jgi:DNA-binding IclR family transcriptional regulator